MQTYYERLGGEQALRRLIDRFYDLMDERMEFFWIRKLHPPELDRSRDKLFMFLSGWLGGPNLYVERFGHPQLRARHLPFSITSSERDQWIACMGQAMAEIGVEKLLRQELEQALFRTADFMRNKADDGQAK
jgi:hemoglobin